MIENSFFIEHSDINFLNFYTLLYVSKDLKVLTHSFVLKTMKSSIASLIVMCHLTLRVSCPVV